MSIANNVQTKPEMRYKLVNIENKNGLVRHYNVPLQNVNSFTYTMNQHEKNMHLYSNIVFFTSIFAGVFGASLFTKNLESRLIQFLVQTASAITLATLSSFGMSKYAENVHKELLQKYNSSEIFYNA